MVPCLRPFKIADNPNTKSSEPLKLRVRASFLLSDGISIVRTPAALKEDSCIVLGNTCCFDDTKPVSVTAQSSSISVCGTRAKNKKLASSNVLPTTTKGGQHFRGGG